MAKLSRKNKVDYWMFKAPLELKKELDKVRLQRIKKGKDMEFQPYNRLGLAIARHTGLLSDLMIADLKKEKKL